MAGNRQPGEGLGNGHNDISKAESICADLKSLTLRLDTLESEVRWSRKVSMILLAVFILWTVKELTLLVVSNIS